MDVAVLLAACVVLVQGQGQGNSFEPCECNSYSLGCLCVNRRSCDSSNVITAVIPDWNFDSMNILKWCNGVEKCCRRPSDSMTTTTPAPTTTSTTTTTPAPTTTTTTTTTPAPTTTTITTTTPAPTIAVNAEPTVFSGRNNPTEPPQVFYANYSECGLRRSQDDVPWMAAIIKTSPDGQSSFLCGASIIHPRVVLTAAGCLTELTADYALTVVAGVTNLNDVSSPLRQERVVNSSSSNQYYNSTSTNFDMALLELTEAFTRSSSVDVICLRQPDSRLDLSSCFAVGFSSGIPGTAGGLLRKVDLVVQLNDICEDKLWNIFDEYYILPEGVSCAEGPSLCQSEELTLQEDYGGPVLCPLEAERTRFVQAGIVLKPLGCGDSSMPTLLTNTSYFGPAIERALMAIVRENYAVHPVYSLP